jgi:hypothetical protein
VLRALGPEIIDPANFSLATPAAFDVGLGSLIFNNESITCATGFLVDFASYLSELTENTNNLNSVTGLRNFILNYLLEDYPDRDVGAWDGALSRYKNLSTSNQATAAFDAWQASVDFNAEGGITGICN